jgi:hypothetical protein
MFTAEGDLQRAVLWWLSQQPEEFFADGEHWPLHHWGSCWNADGDFFPDSCSSFICENHPMGFICTCLIYHITHVCLWHYMPVWPRVAHYLGSWFVFLGIWWDSLDEGLTSLWGLNMKSETMQLNWIKKRINVLGKKQEHRV